MNAQATKTKKVTFEKNDCADGTSSWYVMIDGDCVADLIRDTPTRQNANGVGGIVLDRGADKTWDCTLHNYDGTFSDCFNGTEVCYIPDGSTAAEAKKIVREILPNCI